MATKVDAKRFRELSAKASTQMKSRFPAGMTARKAKAKPKAKPKSGAVRGSGGRFAGRVAPNMTPQAEELLETSGPFAEPDAPVEEAKPAEAKTEKILTADEVRERETTPGEDPEPWRLFPWQKDVLRQVLETRRELLHRRVEVTIFDAKGKRMQSTSFDLAADDTLNVGIVKNAISATQSSGAR